MKKLLLGNEAVALGAYAAGVKVAAAYPGTPSTEILENIAKHYKGDVLSQWSPNEKVALEVAAGASFAGARALCCMKHVGLNVAADPLFTASYTGVGGGLVIVVADDPGMHSSQNEQDSRFYARSAHLPMLEPSDSEECLRFTMRAFEISEQYDTPVLLRLTTRIAHARSMVEIPEGREEILKAYQKDTAKYVMMPANARKRHVVVEKRMDELASAMPECGYTIEKRGALGVITSGAAYQYVREALPDASVMKLNMVYPLSKAALEDFAKSVEKLVVVEELEPFIEDALKAMGIACSGKELTGKQGELSAHDVARLFRTGGERAVSETPGIPVRPPVLCPGCPHRAVFYTLKRMKLTCVADIGCYTLGALPPLDSVDTVLCMGASVGMALGMEKARGRDFSRQMVAAIGDSTFLHSGITPLMDAVYNGGSITVLILDNSTTGMTGHQDHPATGKNARGETAPQVSLEEICASVGVKRIRSVDPFDGDALRSALTEELAADEVSVIIARRPCALLIKPKAPVVIEGCKNCGACMRIGCPALRREGDGVLVDRSVCNGCGYCASLCAFGAIKTEGGEGGR